MPPRTTHRTAPARKNNTMAAEGVWDLSISTPIGTIDAVVELARQDGVLTGTARGAGESVPLSDITLEGDRLTWKQAVTKPLRLNLAFAAPSEVLLTCTSADWSSYSASASMLTSCDSLSKPARSPSLRCNS
jgi:hypothetical protein